MPTGRDDARRDDAEMTRTAVECVKCKRPLGYTDGLSFIVPERIVVRSRFTLYCVSCGVRRNWRPGRSPDQCPNQTLENPEAPGDNGPVDGS